MASKSILICVVFVVVLCLVLIGEPSDCSTGHGCFYAYAAGLKQTQNRKLLQMLAALKEKKAAVKAGLHGPSSGMSGEKSLDWELRKVPSGPDPLHHNGGSPKKPRTP
ncbi:protein CLAVATA 3 [Quillaja saponaria]|uniref:Protein CLAVATA 3 n=1 Tax=Quillaja saponaria TaxID=32244 RepID=A0AAD7KYL9_QUISA|nr:protein CLAVATA 3 [Quillaja saponaria]